MSVEVDKTSHVDPGDVKMSGTTVSSAASMGSQISKVFKFAAKTGFVIPKNKLSGSMVPIFRGNKKLGGSESANGEKENDKQTQRKTKWGPDLTQDTVVRKGRVLAYQTRLEQITQLLNSGILEVPDAQNLALEAENLVDKSPEPQVNYKVQNTELLELEKQKVIGEILKLNPSFKAPPDYRPLLKEDRFLLPVKEYPGYNFIGLIHGPDGENQKRLEKCEIKPTDGHGTQNAYEELFVYMSADTFDKIDAAISVIELLIMSIPGNLATYSSSDLVSGDNKKNSGHGEVTATSNIGLTTTALNQGVMRQVEIHAPTPIQGQFHYPSMWFPTDPSHNLTPGARLISQPNPSTTILNNPIHLSTPTSNFSNAPSMFGRPPPIAFNPAFRNPLVHSPRQQLLAQGLQQPFMAQASLGHVGPPRIHALPIQQSSLVQSNVSTPNFIGSGPSPSGLPANMPGSSVPSPLPQLVPSSLTSGSLPERPMIPTMIPHGLSGAAVGNSSSLAPNNMGHMALSLPPSFGPSAVPQQGFTSGAAPGPPTPQATGIPTNRPIRTPIPSHQMGPRLPFSAPTLLPSPAVNPNFLAGSASTPLKPPTSTGSFTFQPRGPQNPSAQTVINPHVQNLQTVSALQQSAPGTPPFRLAVPNFPGHGSQLFLGTQTGNQMGNPQIQERAASNPTGFSVPPRLPIFLDSAPRTQMHQGNFGPAMQMPNLQGNFPQRPRNPMQFEQGFPTRPDNRLAPNQQFNSNLSLSAGGQQIYDPFSPSSASVSQQQWSNLAK